MNAQDYDPSKPLPIPAHEVFVQARFEGNTSADAYRKAYPKSQKWKPKALFNRASEMDATGEVLGRLQWLQQQAATKKVMTKQRALEILSEMAETTLADFLTQSADGVWFHDFGPETTRKFALKKIKTRTEVESHGRGKNKVEDQAIITEVELENRVSVINKLAEMLGWDAPQKLDVSEVWGWDKVLAAVENSEAEAAAKDKAQPRRRGK